MYTLTLFNPADTMFLTRIVTIDHAIQLLAEFNSEIRPREQVFI